MNQPQYSRITISRPGGAGDVFLTYPLLSEIRRLHPHAKIKMFGHIFAVEMFKDINLIDSYHRQGSSPDPRVYSSAIEILGSMKKRSDPIWEKKMREILGKPELTLFFSVDIPRASFALEMIGLQNFQVADWQTPAATHITEYMISVLRNAGTLSPWNTTYDVQPIQWPYDVPSVIPKHFDKSRSVIIAPGAGGKWKRPPLDLFQKLALELDRDGYLTLVVEGPEEKGLYKDAFPRSLMLRDLTLKEMAGIFNLHLPYIGPDSGLSHLAAITGCAANVIFGPTHPSQWSPLGPDVRIIHNCEEPSRGDCRVCYDKDCLKSITLDMILESFHRGKNENN